MTKLKENSVHTLEKSKCISVYGLTFSHRNFDKDKKKQ